MCKIKTNLRSNRMCRVLAHLYLHVLEVKNARITLNFKLTNINLITVTSFWNHYILTSFLIFTCSFNLIKFQFHWTCEQYHNYMMLSKIVIANLATLVVFNLKSYFKGTFRCFTLKRIYTITL